MHVDDDGSRVMRPTHPTQSQVTQLLHHTTPLHNSKATLTSWMRVSSCMFAQEARGCLLKTQRTLQSSPGWQWPPCMLLHNPLPHAMGEYLYPTAFPPVSWCFCKLVGYESSSSSSLNHSSAAHQRVWHPIIPLTCSSNAPAITTTPVVPSPISLSWLLESSTNKRPIWFSTSICSKMVAPSLAIWCRGY